MHASVRHFMQGLVDYAGLFPPAALPMETAVRDYHRFGQDQDGWMLGRFVIPDARLRELAPYMDLYSQAHPLPLSVIGNRSRGQAECLTLLGGSAARIQSFRAQYPDEAIIDMLELPLPPIPLRPQLLEAIGSGTSAAGLRTFCELTYALADPGWESNMLEALDAIAAYNAVGEAAIGVKLRTGGLAADAFPAPAQVALVLEACRDRRLSLKFTAGLHHPLRMHRQEVHAKMHGFLNVFAAGLLASAHTLERKRLEEIVADENPAHFVFTAEGLRWRELLAASHDIETHRNGALCSYGSCSFDEPRDELRALGLLDQRS